MPPSLARTMRRCAASREPAKACSGLGRQCAECFHVPQNDLARVGDKNGACAAKARDGAADGFDRQSEMIGNVLPARQVQAVAAGGAQAVGQPEKERRHALTRLLATEHEEMLL